MTLNSVHADITSSFCSGQVYVALSRVCYLERLSITSLPHPRSLLQDERVKRFHASIADRSALKDSINAI